SEGRFELGLGLGSRPNDYEAAGVDFRRRGRILDDQLALLVRVWHEGADRTKGAIGPNPFTTTGPRLMFGGFPAPTRRRVAEARASWMCGHGGPDVFRTSAAELDRVWADAGRPGRPRRLMAVYFALGDDAVDHVSTFIHSYFGFAPFKDALLAATPKSADDV